jgi:putative glutamine amidotransferase
MLLGRLDGLILTGGGDIDPVPYNGRPHETIYMLDTERDLSELALVQHVITAGMPTLGICRGAQVLNVALGGTLIEHLPDEVGDEIAHRVPPRGPTRHPVAITPNSRLAEVLAADQISVASWHHQAIRQTAPELTIVARAADGTVEAVEMVSHPWLVAVQWHPELSAADDPTQQRLFDAFVEAARQKKEIRETEKIGRKSL